MVEVVNEGGSIVVRLSFHDLSEEAQEAILEAFGISSPEEMNWDVFPVAEVVVGDGERSIELSVNE